MTDEEKARELLGPLPASPMQQDEYALKVFRLVALMQWAREDEAAQVLNRMVAAEKAKFMAIERHKVLYGDSDKPAPGVFNMPPREDDPNPRDCIWPNNLTQPVIDAAARKVAAEKPEAMFQPAPPTAAAQRGVDALALLRELEWTQQESCGFFGTKEKGYCPACYAGYQYFDDNLNEVTKQHHAPRLPPRRADRREAVSKADEIDHLVDGDSVGDAIGLCGCGSPSLAIELVAKLLAYYRDLYVEPQRTADQSVAYLESLIGSEDKGPFWFILYQLDTLHHSKHGLESGHEGNRRLG